jgi:hypothetical protein
VVAAELEDLDLQVILGGCCGREVRLQLLHALPQQFQLRQGRQLGLPCWLGSQVSSCLLGSCMLGRLLSLEAVQAATQVDQGSPRCL